VFLQEHFTVSPGAVSKMFLQEHLFHHSAHAQSSKSLSRERSIFKGEKRGGTKVFLQEHFKQSCELTE
jgi:hypothetical protein